MTATFWTASAVTFTNGQKTATVTSGSPFNSSQSYANWKLSSGNKNEPVEVKSASGTQIELFENWTGPSGSTTVTMEPSPASAAAAGAAAQALITQIQTLVNSASVTATANSFVKRDSGGRTKTATPIANDDAVNKAYLGSAATKNVGTAAGNLMENGVWGVGSLVGGGLRNSEYALVNDLNESLQPSQVFVYDSATLNRPSTPEGAVIPNGVGISLSRTADIWGQLTLSRSGGSVGAFITRVKDGASVVERLVYDSGNTNFSKFGGNADNDVIAVGFAASSSLAVFYLPLNGIGPPSSISVTGTFAIRAPSAATKIATGLVPTFAGSASSNKIGFLQISTAGLTAGQPLELQTEGAATKIVANY